MMRNRDFSTLRNPQTLTLVHLHVRDSDIQKDYTTTSEIYKRVKKLGLELCPAEVGPHQRLKDPNQPMGEVYFIGMKQIAASGGDPSVFGLERDGDGGLWLNSNWTSPDNKWNPENEFVFSLRKCFSFPPRQTRRFILS